MGWFRRSRQSAPSAGGPPELLTGLGLDRRDRVLGVGLDSTTGRYAVFSRHHMSVLHPDGAVVFSRPWHEVKSGAWEPLTGTISAVWADGGRAAMLTFGLGRDDLADVFRERVQASVVTSEQVVLNDDDGPVSVGRVALRKNLATEELLIQVSLDRGVPRDDAVDSAVARVTAHLWEQVGR